MTIDTLKQAAQALREHSGNSLEEAIHAGPNKRGFYLSELAEKYSKLAAALEAMAGQRPVAFRVLRKTYSGEWTCDGRFWHDAPPHPDLVIEMGARDDWRIEYVYAAPIATPEHDAKVRDAALEEAAKVCEDGAAEAANHRVEFACDILSDRIRDLKSTGADYE